MPGISALLNCVSRRGMFSQKKTVKIQFGVSLNRSFSGDELAEPLRDILIYIAREGVSVINLFRRPGNPKETKEIIDYLQRGRPFDVTTFSFYALANVVKKYLLQMPGGIFGENSEERLLKCLEIADEQERIETMNAVLKSLSPTCKQLTAFLFGIWFRMVYHTEVNGMSLEAIAKSVTGSIFHTCNDDPKKVEHASKCMELLIGNFSSAALFSADLIEYFTQQTKTNISRTEKYCYEFVYPAAVDPNQIESFLRDILTEESAKHGFDYEKDMVSAEEFNTGASAQPDSESAAVVASATSQIASQKTSTSSCVTVANSNAVAAIANEPNASASSGGGPARRQASIERSRTSVGTGPQFAGPVGTRTSRIDIGISQDQTLRRSKTEYGTGVKSPRGTGFNCDSVPCKSEGELEAQDNARRSLEPVDEARLHDRQIAEQRFQSVRQVQLNRLIHRHEWFQSAAQPSDGTQSQTRSTPTSPTTEEQQIGDEKNENETELPEDRTNAGAGVERSCSVLSGPAALESQRIRRIGTFDECESNQSNQSNHVQHTADTTTTTNEAPASDTDDADRSRSVSNALNEAALRRTIEQIPGSETTTVNGECYIKIARYFIVERHYGPDCEQSVQFYQSHFGRTAPQQLSISRHGHEPTKLTTVTEVEVTD